MEIFYIVLGGALSFFGGLFSTSYFKKKDVFTASLNCARAIDFALTEQISTLTNVGMMIEAYESQIKKTGNVSFQKTVMTPALLTITGDKLNTFTELSKIGTFPNIGNIIILFTIVQRLYNELFINLDKFNELQKPENLEKITSLPHDSQIRQGWENEIKSLYEWIVYKHSELKPIQRNVKAKFDLICKEVFSNKYKPIQIQDTIVRAADMLND